MLDKRIDDIIDNLIEREGGYSNNKNDLGGETIYGITEKVARANGYKGVMNQMPVSVARQIYFSEYVIKPGFDKVVMLSPAIAFELVDTGINMGVDVSARFFQRVLNAFNDKGELYADIPIDGDIGRVTMNALSLYLARRGAQAEKGMLAALNSLQGARYIHLCEAREANESFAFGWLINRVAA
jgi:lysozyme family protein